MTKQIPKHGTEFFRLEKNQGETDLAVWTKLVRSLKSSGVILEKRVCLSKPTVVHKEGREYSWGWKAISRLKPSEFPAYVKKLQEEGWVLLVGQQRLKRTMGS